MLVQQGLQTLQRKSAKHIGMLDEDWEELDPKATSMIQLYLADKVTYNIMDEKKAMGLWSKLENIVYDKEHYQQAVLEETIILAMHEKRDITVGASELLQQFHR